MPEQSGDSTGLTPVPSPPRGPSTRRWVLVLATCVWVLLLLAWTAALLRPVPTRVTEAVPSSLRFLAAKALHLTVYGALAFLATWLASRNGARAAIWTALLAHAALTEYGQTFVPGRSGAYSDVAINSLGIALGLGAGVGVRALAGRWARG